MSIILKFYIRIYVYIIILGKENAIGRKTLYMQGV